MTDTQESKVESKDHWSHQAYTNAASFVPALTRKVLEYLDPQPEDEILDVGCGDGVLTADFAPRCKTIVGLDSSKSMIQTSIDKVVPAHSNTSFFVKNCRSLRPGEDGLDPEILRKERYDKVFSNAAMHWILGGGEESSRLSYFSDVIDLLKPGGTFVFEMGGAGNVAEAHSMLISAVSMYCNVPIDKVRSADPWYYPSDVRMRQILENAGFAVEKCELEYRPTKLTPKASDGSGGVEGWIKLMGAPFLEVVKDESQRQEVVSHISRVLEPVLQREEDDSPWLGYVRLRVVARKP